MMAVDAGVAHAVSTLEATPDAASRRMVKSKAYMVNEMKRRYIDLSFSQHNPSTSKCGRRVPHLNIVMEVGD
jgi:hypothetical protein